MYPFIPCSTGCRSRKRYQRTCYGANKNIVLANGLAALLNIVTAFVNLVAALFNGIATLIDGEAVLINGTMVVVKVAALVICTTVLVNDPSRLQRHPQSTLGIHNPVFTLIRQRDSSAVDSSFLKGTTYSSLRFVDPIPSSFKLSKTTFESSTTMPQTFACLFTYHTPISTAIARLLSNLPSFGHL